MTPQQRQDRPPGYLAKLYALRNKVDEQIAAEVLRQARITAAAAEIDVPTDEEPDRLITEKAVFSGRPLMADTHTYEEMLRAHAAKQRGATDEWTLAGERQYQRQRDRATGRGRKKAS